MSKEFIQGKKGGRSVEIAARQQRQLSYFTTSEVQEDLSLDYFKHWAERNYNTNVEFLNWVKNVFKTANFMSFAKYYRNPNPAAKLINSRVREPLTMVFFSEDSYFNYTIKGQQVDAPAILNDDFEDRLFESLLFRHNDIIIHDLSDINTPFREFVGMDKVVAIEVRRNEIIRLSYTAEATLANGEKVLGYAYIDSERYAFYNKDIEEIVELNFPHDLGRTPATFVSKDAFDNDPIVKRGVFSYLRSDLEEYVFLKTLQKMTEPNGAIPISVKIKTTEITDEGSDADLLANEPMSAASLGPQRAKDANKKTSGHGTALQAGTQIEVPAIEKADGAIDMELAKNFLTFYYTPIEALKYIAERIKEIEANIVTSSIGDHSEGNEASMTEKQVQKTFVSKEDKLRALSNNLSWARGQSDSIMLGLQNGYKDIKVDAFYGSDFFWETPEKLYEMIQKSPNAIERKNLLIRLAKRRNMFNPDKASKEEILYKLMPYSNDLDFKLAVDNQQVDDITFQLQTRFIHWVQLFEATYGSLTTFWESMEASDSEKIILLQRLLIQLIKSNVGKPTPKTTE